MVQKLCIILILTLTGCAYMGIHGKSIRSFPDIHDGAVEDSQCLSCHDPAANPDIAPVSPHPKFTECLKCHNDEF
ncbi:MAG: cytochrome c3 family protein [Proteobacteria bacterium]|nr:cytochrome c3 family protein [Pseudomonadota bacterium]MBU4010718.1 cytochrome c3 family protein [Pseudomonadota bacterium]